MQGSQNYSSETRSVLASLRMLIPQRSLQFTESLRVAELQANRLRELSDLLDGPLPSDLIAGLPRIRIEWRDMPTSGLSYWDGDNWIITLNRSEPETRQRFTLCHEYKHIVDHGRVASLYTGHGDTTAQQQAEQAADYFAGCLLMPKRLLKQAWGHGVQRPTELAALFDVSQPAVQVRLAQTGLSAATQRCANRSRRSVSRRTNPRTYFRSSLPLRPATRLEMA